MPFGGEEEKSVESLLLTASGGPFFGLKKEEMEGKTKADALKHPNWSMGQKITIDSATMVNKGLEMMEAHWLFNIPMEKIQVVIQRESIFTFCGGLSGWRSKGTDGGTGYASAHCLRPLSRRKGVLPGTKNRFF